MEKKPTRCDVCGELLTCDTAVEVVVMKTFPIFERIEKLFGKAQFDVCYVCYLKSLGIRTKEE